MEKTVFEIFGIENKETKLSNLFSYYIEKSRSFLNLLCVLSDIETVDIDKDITVEREYYFTLEGYNNRNNYIDIVVFVGNKNAPDRVISIENKVNSSEGYKQTERYYKGMEVEYPKVKKDYIFITKNNSFVKLSSAHFKHIRYMDLIDKVKGNDELMTLPYIGDFCEYYYEREHRIFAEIEKTNNIIDKNIFIDYFVWKANTDKKYKDMYVSAGASAKDTNDRFLQVSKQSWLFNNMDVSDEMTFHLEGDNKKIKLHFETYPYFPYSKMEAEMKGKYEKVRDEIRQYFEGMTVDGVEVKPANKKEDLTIISFVLSDYTSLKTFDTWIEMVNLIDGIIKGHFGNQ